MQGRKTKVSVIVVNFNGMPHLEACLSSIGNQTYQDLEVIFVDNASTDGSLDYARRRFPNLLIIENKENLGYPGGINRGVAHATGEYIAPINFDTEVDQDWLACMVAFMDENPSVGAVTPKSLLYHDRTKIGTLGLNIHITGLGFARGLGQADSESPHNPLRVAGVSGCSFLIRREILEQMGGLNEDIFMYYDDVDLSWTINSMGYEIYCLPESIVYHKYDLRMSSEKLFSLEHGRLNLLLRYMKPLTFVLCLPALLLTELLVMGYCVARGRRYVSAKLRALVSPFKDIRRLVKKRSEAQRLRRISDFQLLSRLQLNYEWRQLFHILR